MSISESAFQESVIDLARWSGWKLFHARTVKTDKGRHLTAYTGDKGFPDLVLAHQRYGVIFAELKTEKGRISDEQRDWAIELKHGGAEFYVWRPSDWEQIKKRLKGEKWCNEI